MSDVERAAVAGCVRCHKLVAVVDAKYSPPKLRRHKGEDGNPCSVPATSAYPINHARRQAAWRQRQLAKRAMA